MERLEAIREQKEQLKKKILKLQGEKGEDVELTPEAMAALYERKAKLEHERLQQEKYRKMQEEYGQRKAQMEREKQLEKIRNEKRMIELEVGMKRIVLNGVQEKVKGINSDQLMARAMLSNESGQTASKYQVEKSKQQIKEQFEKYLQKESVKKERPKNDLYALNEKRFDLFEKKEELLMRQVLLKEVLNNGDESALQEMDIMNCSKQQLQRLLQENGIDIEDYRHALNPKDIIDNIGNIQQTIKTNLTEKRKEVEYEEEKAHRLRKEKAQLKAWIRAYPNPDAVYEIGLIIDQLLSQLVFEYEKRHFSLSKQEKEQKINELQKEYQTIIMQNECYQLAEQIVSQIQATVTQSILQQVASQIHQLHTFSHDTTEMSFDWLFPKRSYLDLVSNEQQTLKLVPLNFARQTDNIRYDKNKNKKDNQPMGKKDNNIEKEKENIFDTEKLTSELINDIKLLTSQEDFFQSVSVQVKREVIQSIEQNQFKVKSQNGFYLITNKGIKLISEEKDTSRNILTFLKQIRNIKNVKKFNNLWLIQTQDKIYCHSQWNIEVLPMPIGQRINNPSGYITSLEIYPSFTLLGSLCSILIGFEKGQVLKYNFNRNRITSIQTSITHYTPLAPNIKTGDQPAFPLNNRNIIDYKSQKATQGQQLHEFRQFFDHHTAQIIGICCYKDNKFITVDKTMNCVIWMYDTRRGVKSYQPYYTFKLKSEFKIYKESDNPRFKDLYPSPTFPQTPQQLYSKWMEQQTYLKMQIYNNPKKNSAFFKSPQWDNSKTEQPIWKLNYDDNSKRIIKVFETYYNLVDAQVQCKQVKLWKEYLVFLVERPHLMRNDIKTIKIYAWSIQDKKLRTVAIEFDTFNQQKVFAFHIIENNLDGSDYPMIATISSGKILLFSMLSGQLLKDISDEPSCSKVKGYNFLSLQRGFFDNFYATTRASIVEFIIKNKNSRQKNNDFNKTISITRKKYNNLI